MRVCDGAGMGMEGSTLGILGRLLVLGAVGDGQDGGEGRRGGRGSKLFDHAGCHGLQQRRADLVREDREEKGGNNDEGGRRK